MLKGIYTPLSGALAQEKVLDVIANNLANVSTVGFKGEKVGFKYLVPEPGKHYKEPLPPANYKIPLESHLPIIPNEIGYAGIAEVHRDDSQGSAIRTGNSLDMMLEGDGYFEVSTPEGVRFTRNGAFTLNESGVLVDKAGHPILGEKGVISVSGKDFEINSLGEVFQDRQLIDRLQISTFEYPDQLEKIGLNLFHYSGSEEDKNISELPSVKQGYLEGSNVNAIQNLTAMIIAHRSYEAYQKTIKNYDSMMERSSNSIGRIQV